MPDLVSSQARFGPFTFDVRTGELLKGGTRIKVPDQSIEILTTLLERPGDLVTREELRQRLWPDNTFVDFEHGLNAAVRRLRDLLGDSAEAPRYIETLPRRGYRFVATVVAMPAGRSFGGDRGGDGLVARWQVPGLHQVRARHAVNLDPADDRRRQAVQIS